MAELCHAVRSADAKLVEVRYERMVDAPDEVAAVLAAYLEAPVDSLAAALQEAHASSVGRWREDLTEAQLTDVLAEAGELLRELGYV